jgi:hypothetical protein
MRGVPVRKITEQDPYWDSNWFTKDHLRSTGGLQQDNSCTDMVFFDSAECSFHPNQILSKEYIRGTGLVNRNYLPKLKSQIVNLKKTGRTDAEALHWLRVRFLQIIEDTGDWTKQKIITLAKEDAPYLAILEEVGKLGQPALKRPSEYSFVPFR